MQFRVISIGASASHALWNEREAVRTGHATTTLIQSGDRTILVDPGLRGGSRLEPHVLSLLHAGGLPRVRAGQTRRGPQ